MKRIALLGSTGSIGTQTLDVIARNPGQFSLAFLACGSNKALLEQQAARFGAVETYCAAEDEPQKLTDFLAAGSYDLAVNAMVGMRGLQPTLAALAAGKPVALANKETLVAGGHLVMEQARLRNVPILPVDSEHSAVFQCLQAVADAPLVPPFCKGTELKRLLLTASGGPFRGRKAEELKHITAADALKHPNWTMGAKVTIDSATLMNKGLEVIEACHLFHLTTDQVQVVVHPESIIHSAVELEDGAVLAQLGAPDMRVPIAYALSFPDRMQTGAPRVDLFALGSLHFEQPDTETFRCLKLALQAHQEGGTYPVVLNAANEVLVHRFIKGEIGFLDIAAGVEDALDRFGNPDAQRSSSAEEQLRAILETDARVRREL